MQLWELNHQTFSNSRLHVFVTREQTAVGRFQLEIAFVMHSDKKKKKNHAVSKNFTYSKKSRLLQHLHDEFSTNIKVYPQREANKNKKKKEERNGQKDRDIRFSQLIRRTPKYIGRRYVGVLIAANNEENGKLQNKEFFPLPESAA